MTLEEAGDIILRGTPQYIPCTACLGVRYSHEPAAASQALGCSECGGFGHIENPIYLEACRILGMEPPKPFTEVITNAVSSLNVRGVHFDAKSIWRTRDLVKHARKQRQGA